MRHHRTPGSRSIYAVVATLAGLLATACGEEATVTGPDAAAETTDTAVVDTADTAAADTGPVDTGAPDTTSPDTGPGDVLGRNPTCDAPSDCGAATGPCRAWYCDSKLGCVEAILPDGAACAGIDGCTVGAACSAGSCVGGGPKHCDDGDPCTADDCSDGVCASAPLPADATVACEDDNTCTVGDHCEGGSCKGGANVCLCQNDADCAGKNGGNLCAGTWFCAVQQDGSRACQLNPATVVICDGSSDTPCQKNLCEPSSGLCGVVQFGEGDPCEDGVFCTVGETCQKGQCKGGTDVCCTADVDCAKVEDGDACNGTLFCNLAIGKCQLNPQTIVTCPSVDDTICAKNTCDTKTGACKPKPTADGELCDDGNPCTPSESCKGGACTATANTCLCQSDADCADKDDGDPCNGTSYCDLKDKTCKTNPATVVVCPSVDDTTCSKNTCDPKDGQCKQKPVFDGTACNADDNPCTPNDACKAGACEIDTVNTCVCSTNADCAAQDDGDLCNGSLFCEKTDDAGNPLAKGTCKVNPSTVVSCPSVDNTACTVSLCQPKTGKCAMTFVHQGEVCDDGDPCTKGDVCENGQCKAGGDICLCKADQDCLPQEDGDACNGTLYCAKDALPWSCQVKPSSVITCPTVNDSYCQKSICQPLTGLCVLTPLHIDEPCDDGDVCTVNTVCKGGFCFDPLADSGGKCNDGNPCTTDSCDKTLGCIYKANTATCEDGDPCTEGDLCASKVCKPGKAKVCSDGNPCTTDLCNKQTGCVTFANSDPCTDGDACTLGDTCKGGQCVPGDAKVCKDTNPCSADTCDSKTGNCVFDTQISGSIICDDGVPCTLDDCNSITGCSHIAADKACDDKVDCTTDTCSLTAGCLHLADDLACDDDDACTTDSCVAGIGCKHAGVVDGTPCLDSDPCTVGDTCKAGKCAAGTAIPACSVDPTQCKGKSNGTACNDGDACTKGETCGGGVCRALPDKLVVETLVQWQNDQTIDGPLARARTRFPRTVALAPSGAIGWASAGIPALRELGTDGIVRRRAGNPIAYNGDAATDGKAGVAIFGIVTGLVYGADGTAYLVDGTHHVVRKVAPNGDVTTIAGSVQGAADGKGATAAFSEPQDLAIASDGALLVADRLTHAIRRVALDGTVTTFAGKLSTAGGVDGKGGIARLNQPYAIAAAPDGTFVFLDRGGHTMRRLQADGTVTTIAGKYGNPAATDGPTGTNRIYEPCDLTVAASGEVYFVECTSRRLRRLGLDGAVTTLVGAIGAGYTDGPAATARFGEPMGLTFDAFGDLIVADYANQRIRRVRMRHDTCDDGNPCTIDSCDPLSGKCKTSPSDCSDGQLCTKDNCDTKTGACSWSAEPDGSPCNDGDVCSVADVCASGFCHATSATTHYGDGKYGSIDGPLAVARFVNPFGLKAGADGRIVVTETGAHRVRVIGVDGQVRSIAGDNGGGFKDGPANEARFNSPVSATFGPGGVIYVADANNHRVRAIDPDGTVTTVAGNGAQGFLDGPAETARFSVPSDVQHDSSGALLVSDRYNHRIRRVVNGVVSTLTGAGPGLRDGPLALALFDQPLGLDVGADGAIYVADHYNHAIRKIGVDGTVRTLIGSRRYEDWSAVGSAASLAYPHRVAVRPDGALWISSWPGRVALLEPGGLLRFVSGGGSGTSGKGTAWSHPELCGIVAMPDGGAMVAWQKGHRLLKIDAPLKNCDDANACTADACTVKVGCVHVASAVSCSDGDPCTAGDLCAAGSCKPGAKVAGCVCKATAGFGCDDNNPCTTEGCDPKTGCSHVARDGDDCSDDSPCTTGDRCKGTTCLANPDARAVVPAGGLEGTPYPTPRDGPIVQRTGVGMGGLRSPGGLAIDDKGTIAVADVGNHAIRILEPDGSFDTLAGAVGQAAGYRDGARFEALFWEPYDVAPGKQGDWYVADRANHLLRRVDADGNVTTVAGKVKEQGLVDGKAGTARFRGLIGLCADDAGGVVVADADNNAIRKVSGDGTVTTIAGNGLSAYSDGPGEVATFQLPTDVARSPDGTLWVVEYYGRRLRRIDGKGVVSTALRHTADDAPDEGVGMLGTRLGGLTGVAADASGVYIADWGFASVRRYDPVHNSAHLLLGGGKVELGFGHDSTAPSVRGIVIAPDGSVVVALQDRHRLRRLRPVGKACDDANACTLDTCDPKAGCKHTEAPLAVLCPDGGDCLQPSCDVAEGFCRYAPVKDGTACGDGKACNQQCVRGNCIAGGVLDEAIGTGIGQRVDGPAGKAAFQQPVDLVGDGTGKLYVAEWGSASIRVVAVDGSVSTLAGGAQVGYAEGKGSAARFNGPTAIAYDASTLYVADYHNSRVRKVDLEGNVITVAGSGEQGFTEGVGLTAKLRRPAGVAAKAGVVWIADTDNHAVRRLEGGKVVTVAGKGGTCGNRDGALGDNALCSPTDIALDAKNRLVVCDTYGHMVRRLEADGRLVTILGDASYLVRGHIDGSGWRGGSLAEPRHIHPLPDGSVLISAHSWREIRRGYPSDRIDALVGAVSDLTVFQDGMGVGARLGRQAGIGGDGKGGIWVADMDNHRLRRLRVDVTGCADLVGSSPTTAAKSCLDWQAKTKIPTANLVWIDPNPDDALPPFATRCNQTIEGGGWTLVPKDADEAEVNALLGAKGQFLYTCDEQSTDGIVSPVAATGFSWSKKVAVPGNWKVQGTVVSCGADAAFGNLACGYGVGCYEASGKTLVAPGQTAANQCAAPGGIWTEGAMAICDKKTNYAKWSIWVRNVP